MNSRRAAIEGYQKIQSKLHDKSSANKTAHMKFVDVSWVYLASNTAGFFDIPPLLQADQRLFEFLASQFLCLDVSARIGHEELFEARAEQIDGLRALPELVGDGNVWRGKELGERVCEPAGVGGWLWMAVWHSVMQGDYSERCGERGGFV